MAAIPDIIILDNSGHNGASGGHDSAGALGVKGGTVTVPVSGGPFSALNVGLSTWLSNNSIELWDMHTFHANIFRYFYLLHHCNFIYLVVVCNGCVFIYVVYLLSSFDCI